MPLHMIKLCVGVDSVEDLEAQVRTRLSAGPGAEQTHVTRVMPKRADEMIGAGSLFWVIKGQVAARQRLIDVRPFTDGDGIGRCHLVLEPAVVPVETRPCRPFQGWRYLDTAAAPRDAGLLGPDLLALPDALRRELRDLGLI